MRENCGGQACVSNRKRENKQKKLYWIIIYIYDAEIKMNERKRNT